MSNNINKFSDIKYLNTDANNEDDGNNTYAYKSKKRVLNWHHNINNSLIKKTESLNNSIYKYLESKNNINEDDIDRIALENIQANYIASNELYDNNKQLMIMLSNRLQQVYNNDKYNRILLDDVSNNINITDDQIADLKKDIQNKERNLEINLYYESKMNHQTQIIKDVVIFLLILFAISLLYKFDVISSNVFVVLIGAGLALISLYVFYKMIDIIFRDNTNYDEYVPLLHSSTYLNKNPIKKENISKLNLNVDLLPDDCKSSNESEEKPFSF